MKQFLMEIGAVTDSINDALENATGSSGDVSVRDTLQPIVLTVFFMVGIIAAVMIVLGGIFYATSQGDAGKIKRAKDTLMYGIIGMVVALLAFAIVEFVLLSVIQG